MGEFVHLHLHSEYSLLDGACRVSDIPLAAKREKHHAVAITDHGVMYGAVQFYRACKEQGILPIIGCEVYVAPRSRFDKNGRADASGYHLVLLVENETGYRNLIALVSAGFLDGFYAKPRVDTELLRSHHEGLIALSACLAGKIPQEILAGDLNGAEQTAREMEAIFGKDHFYLEVQDHALTDEKTVAVALRDLSARTGIGLVATNDVHYLRQEDAETQAILLCVQTGNVITDGRPIGFETDEFYYKSTEEMKALFSDYPGAIENTVKIAEMCRFDFRFGETHLPTFAPPPHKTHRECLGELAEAGFRARVSRGYIDFSCASEEYYRARMEEELSVIDRMGFCAYFLIVQDFVAFAKRSGIPVGPGRGSGAGSLVAYCIGITDIDPLRYDLLFERFLNPERVSLPDFDIDFCYDRRGEVIEYVKRKYGADHVAQIVTFGTMAARAAVRDVGRALGMPYGEVDRVARLIPHEPNVTIADALQKSELHTLYDSSPETKRLLDIAMMLEGMPRHASTHAAGIVITEQPTSYYVPLSTNGDTVVTQYDMDTDAALGLVKFDFLGLRYLTILADAERAVRETDSSFSLAKIPIDDAAAYRLMSEGRTNGIFQLESSGMRQLLSQMKPRTLEDVIAAIALYRPGPMDSIPRYIAARNGSSTVTYDVPALKKILSVTNGCIVYQEQVMQICRELAGYSFAHADVVRRAMAKKKADVMAAERAAFEAGAAARGVPAETAKKVFDDMVGFASYAFNKSHAAAYALIAYRTAYMKAHYMPAYMAALMTSVLSDTVKLGEYIGECQQAGIAVLAPDINESGVYFSAVGNNIRFGLLAVKNVGAPFAEKVLTERKNGTFSDFEDFVNRMAETGDLNRRQMESLIKCGAFDNCGTYRSRLLASYEQMISAASARVRGNLTGQMDLFSSSAALPQSGFSYPELPDFSGKEKILLEKESMGMSFSGHLLDDYREQAKMHHCISVAALLQSYSEESGESDQYRDGQSVSVLGAVGKCTSKKTRSGEEMAFFLLEERYATMEIVVFPKLLQRYHEAILSGNVVLAGGHLSFREGEKPKLILETLQCLHPDESEKPKERRLFLKVPDIADPICRSALTLAKGYPGDVTLVFYDSHTGRYLPVKEMMVSDVPDLLAGLSRLLGEKNVVLR